MSNWWKFYLFVTSLQVIGAPLAAYLTATLGLREAIDWMFISIGALGLFGYVYKKDIGQPQLWLVFLPLFVAWDIWARLVEPSITAPRPDTMYYVMALGLFGLLTPQYIALYRYGRRGTSSHVP